MSDAQTNNPLEEIILENTRIAFENLMTAIEGDLVHTPEYYLFKTTFMAGLKYYEDKNEF